MWYEKGVEWAKAKGVSDGTDPKAISPVSSYATDAMRWAVSSGIIGGMGDGTLAPQGNATRAQVAVMLMRFVENQTK